MFEQGIIRFGKFPAKFVKLIDERCEYFSLFVNRGFFHRYQLIMFNRVDQFGGRQGAFKSTDRKYSSFGVDSVNGFGCLDCYSGNDGGLIKDNL